VSESWRMHVSIRPGGLLRCCLATLDEHVQSASEQPKEGDRLMCKHCRNVGGGMVFNRGAWEWANERGA